MYRLDEQQGDERVATINLLSRISGIGPAAAKKFYEEGVRSLADLEKRKHELNHHQQIGACVCTAALSVVSYVGLLVVRFKILP